VFPSDKVWETPFFVYESGYFENVQTYFWTLMTKFVPIFLLAIWFATCKHWWYHAIVIPLSMFIFQFIGALVLDFEREGDSLELYVMIPIIAGIIFLLYYIRNNLSNRIQIINLDDDIDKELEKIDRLDEIKAKEKEKRARAGSKDINDLL
jgi:amino acid permease